MFTNEEIIHDHTSDTTELGSARVETGEPPGRVQVEWLVGVSGDGVCTLLQPGARLQEKLKIVWLCARACVSECVCARARVCSPTNHLNPSPAARVDLGEGVGVAARPEPFVLQGLGLEKEHLAPFLLLEDQRFEIRFEPAVLRSEIDHSVYESVDK